MLFPAPQSRRRPAPARRGGAYILLLGVATLVTVAGLGSIAVSRVRLKSSVISRDWAAAGALASGAAETAITTINARPKWRTDLICCDPVNMGVINGGKVSYFVEDQIDGDLANDPTQPVRIVATATRGEATRLFSLQAAYQPPQSLDVLKYALYAPSISIEPDLTIAGAPIYTPGNLRNQRILTADVLCGTLANSGTITGRVTTGVKALSPTSDGSLSALPAQAVEIKYSALPSGRIDRVVLGPNLNPFGAGHARGLYLVRVPLGATLEIQRSRISGSLIVELGLLSKLEIYDKVCWSPATPDLPSMIVFASATATVTFRHSGGVLSESSENTNYNPPGAPYLGSTNLTQLDTYPSEVAGVMHFFGSLTTIEINADGALNGTLISEAPVAIRKLGRFTYDSAVRQSPPTAYQTGPASMAAVPGSWTWETAP